MFKLLTSFILLVTLFYLLFVKKTTTTRQFTTTAVQTTHQFDIADNNIATISYGSLTLPQQQQVENPLTYRGYRSKRSKTTQYYNGRPL